MTAVDKPAFLAGGGAMGDLIRRHDWARHPLGVPDQWPQSLRTAVRLLLNTGHPMYIFWGSRGWCFYNDAYSASIGAERHPSSLGCPAREVWAEIWDVIGPQVDQVMSGRGATWNENQLIPITRHGRQEDVYWTYSYGPIDDDNAENGVGGVLVVCAETTQTVLAERSKADEVARQRKVFMQAPGFIIIMSGPEHRVEFVNEAHHALFGSHDWLGKPLRAAFPDISGQGFFELLDEVRTTGKVYRSGAAEVRFRNPTTGAWETKTLDFMYAPITDQSHGIAGVFCEGFDVTDQREIERALRASEEQLRLATEAADVGLWDVDVVNDTLFWPPRVKAMFGISPGVAVSMKDFYEGLHADDRDATAAAYRDATDPQKRRLYDVEYRTVGKEDGIVRWVAAKGRGVFDSSGRCVRVIGAAIDITRRKSVEAQLTASEARLRDSDRRKDIFLATLAHELRNPLSPIRNSVYLLRRPEITPAVTSTVADMIERQVKTMASLLDDLLEVTRISLGKVELKMRVVTAASVIRAALEATSPALDAKRQRLVMPASQTDLWIEVDPLRMSQVLTNLLANASKYTPSGGRIELCMTALPHGIEFAVADDGIGIEAANLPSLFDMFTQVADAQEEAHGGLGIGLAVSRALVELHGGSIQAESAGLGSGSRFVVSLPWSGAKAGQSSAGGPNPRERLATRRVLVADDNRDAANSLADLLRTEGFEVRVVHDGRHAVEIAPTFKPDVCFLDIGMPGRSGLEVARILRGLPGGNSLLLVATTGWGSEDDKQKSHEAGMDAHLTKPVAFEDAMALIVLHRAP